LRRIFPTPRSLCVGCRTGPRHGGTCICRAGPVSRRAGRPGRLQALVWPTHSALIGVFDIAGQGLAILQHCLFDFKGSMAFWASFRNGPARALGATAAHSQRMRFLAGVIFSCSEADRGNFQVGAETCRPRHLSSAHNLRSLDPERGSIARPFRGVAPLRIRPGAAFPGKGDIIFFSAL